MLKGIKKSCFCFFQFIEKKKCVGAQFLVCVCVRMLLTKSHTRGHANLFNSSTTWTWTCVLCLYKLR